MLITTPGVSRRRLAGFTSLVCFAIGPPAYPQGGTHAPTIPQAVQTIRAPKAGTGIASPNASTFMCFMVAHLAGHEERARAVRPHIGERHRRSAVAILGHAGTLTQGSFERLANGCTVAPGPHGLDQAGLNTRRQS
jgi:hypothetical protein